MSLALVWLVVSSAHAPAAWARSGGALAQEPSHKIGVFARVPEPGTPDAAVLGPDGLFYTTTFNQQYGRGSLPSKVFGFSPDGKLVREYAIAGQRLEDPHPLTGMAFDGEERLYVNEPRAHRVLRLDPRRRSQEVYATFADLAPCDGSNGPSCSPGARDFPPVPDHMAFAPDGSLFVTDAMQGVIWRIPKGGGAASVWFGDRRLQLDIGEPFFGPGGIRLMPDRRTLMFVTLLQRADETVNWSSGVVWTIQIQPDGRAGQLRRFWESRPGDAPYEVDFGRSGKIYVSLIAKDVRGGVAVLSAGGEELERFPTAVENQLLEVPFDEPHGIGFDDRGRLILANQSYSTQNKNSWALLAVDVGDRGVPTITPRIGPSPTTTRPTRFLLGPTRGMRRADAQRPFRVRARALGGLLRGARLVVDDARGRRVGRSRRFSLGKRWKRVSVRVARRLEPGRYRIWGAGLDRTGRQVRAVKRVRLARRGRP